MKDRRYNIDFDTLYVYGRERRWPKGRAIARAEQLARDLDGVAVVSRIEDGEVNVVHRTWWPDQGEGK